MAAVPPAPAAGHSGIRWPYRAGTPPAMPYKVQVTREHDGAWRPQRPPWVQGVPAGTRVPEMSIKAGCWRCPGGEMCREGTGWCPRGTQRSPHLRHLHRSTRHTYPNGCPSSFNNCLSSGCQALYSLPSTSFTELFKHKTHREGRELRGARKPCPSPGIWWRETLGTPEVLPVPTHRCPQPRHAEPVPSRATSPAAAAAAPGL